MTDHEDLRHRLEKAMHFEVCDCLKRGHGFTLRSRDLDALTDAVMGVVGPVLTERGDRADRLRADCQRAEAELDQVHTVLADVLGESPGRFSTSAMAKAVGQRITITRAQYDGAVRALDEQREKLNRAEVLAHDRRQQVLRLEHELAGVRGEREPSGGGRLSVLVVPEDWRDQVRDVADVAGQVHLLETWLLPGDDRSAASDVLMGMARRNVELLAERKELLDTLGAIWLYVNWRYVSKQLTTEQKELWADAVDQFGEPEEGKAERWWRESSPDSGKAESRETDSAPFKVGDWVRVKVPRWSEPWQIQAISLARIDGTSATAKRLYRTEGLWYLAWDVERAASPESTEGASDAQ